jgi:transcription antitermination factor NusG
MAKADKLTHHDRVKMLIDIFGQMVPVEMDPEQLEEVAPKSGKAA